MIEVANATVIEHKPGTRRKDCASFTVRVRTGDGQIIRVDVGTDRKKAWRRCAEIEEEVRAGRHIAGHVGRAARLPLTFGEVAERCLTMGTSISPYSLLVYRKRLDHWFEIIGRDVPWSALTDDTIQGAVATFRNMRDAEGALRWKPNTLTGALVTIKKVLKFGDEMKSLGANRNLAAAVGKIERAQSDNAAREYLNESESQLVFDTIEATATPHIVALLALLIETGCRVGEALALSWDKVDLTTDPLTIRILRTAGSSTTKTKKSRVVYAGQRSRAALLRLRLSRGGDAVPADALVFPDANGSEVRQDKGLVYALKKAEKLLPGIGHLHPHLFRHSLITRLLAAGNNPAAISQLTGHTVKELLSTYAHARSDEIRALVSPNSKPASKTA